MAIIETGDIVLHKPTGEQWVVACVVGEKLSWCGWPEGSANLEDCELIQVASDDERFSLLQEMSRMPGNDHRKRYAIEKLKDYEEA